MGAALLSTNLEISKANSNVRSTGGCYDDIKELENVVELQPRSAPTIASLKESQNIVNPSSAPSSFQQWKRKAQFFRSTFPCSVFPHSEIYVVDGGRKNGGNVNNHDGNLDLNFSIGKR